MTDDEVRAARASLAFSARSRSSSAFAEVTTKAAQAELERLRTENAALKHDLQYARDGLTKGRTRMREDNERLAREAYTWSKAAETYAAEAERLRAALRQLVDVEDMRLRLRQLHEMGRGTDYTDYHRLFLDDHAEEDDDD